MSDRRVHGRMPDGTEIVRYERRGHWFEEGPDGRRVKITTWRAASLASAGEWHWNLPGGMQFDRLVRRMRGSDGDES